MGEMTKTRDYVWILFKDRIRSMTDEELAELLYSLQTEDLDGMFCKTEDKCEEMMDSGDEITKSMCKQCLVEWLKAESEE